MSSPGSRWSSARSPRETASPSGVAAPSTWSSRSGSASPVAAKTAESALALLTPGQGTGVAVPVLSVAQEVLDRPWHGAKIAVLAYDMVGFGTRIAEERQGGGAHSGTSFALPFSGALPAPPLRSHVDVPQEALRRQGTNSARQGLCRMRDAGGRPQDLVQHLPDAAGDGGQIRGQVVAISAAASPAPSSPPCARCSSRIGAKWSRSRRSSRTIAAR